MLASTAERKLTKDEVARWAMRFVLLVALILLVNALTKLAIAASFLSAALGFLKAIFFFL